MTKIFSGIIKTTDGKKWSVGFQALSWNDAEFTAENLGVSELGLSLGTTGVEPTDGSPSNLEPPVSHFCGWHYRGGKFVDES